MMMLYVVYDISSMCMQLCETCLVDESISFESKRSVVS